MHSYIHDIHIYMHAYTYIHVFTHRIHTHMHSYIACYVYIYTCIHSHSHAIYIYTCMHSQSHAYTYIYMACIHIYVCHRRSQHDDVVFAQNLESKGCALVAQSNLLVDMHAFIRTCMHAYIYTCIHTYMHSYTYMHAYIHDIHIYTCMHA